MSPVTGGLGFIGSHTVRALLDLGETCIATTHRRTAAPVFLEEEVGRRLHRAPLDISDQDAYLALGRGRDITAIVHLAASPLGSEVFEELRVNLTGLAHTLQAAEAWGVQRVCIASSIGDSPASRKRPSPWSCRPPAANRCSSSVRPGRQSRC